MLVEDEDSLRQGIADFLGQQGFKVAAYADPEAALAGLRANPPDILVTDVIMPKLSGVQLASAVRDAYPDVKVLFMSGYAGSAEEACKGQQFLRKPFSLETLSAAILRCLGDDTLPVRRPKGIARSAKAGG